MTFERASCDTPGCILTTLGRTLVGAGLVLVGGLMTVTLWLLPVGVPLALLGVGVILSAAPVAPGLPRALTVHAQKDGVGERAVKRSEPLECVLHHDLSES